MLVLLFLVTWALVSSCTHPSPSSSSVEGGISAMARLDAQAYLIAQDYKNHPETRSLPRLQVLEIHQDTEQIETNPIRLIYTPEISLPPNDLEALCAIPGRLNEFLLAESGYTKGKAGRVFHLRMKKDGETWRGEVLKNFPLFPLPTTDYSTPKSEHIEGMACIESPNKNLWLVLGKRGGHSNQAALVWGILKELEKDTPIFHQVSETTLSNVPNNYGDRGISDLYLKPVSSTQWKVWAAATTDPGEFGPFRSVIYSPGTVSFHDSSELSFTASHPDIGWNLDGFKVEALASHTQLIEKSVLIIGTDEEVFGGVWRPLFSSQR